MVKKALSHIAYQIILPPSWKIHNIFHANYLLPYKETIEHGPNFPEPLSNIIEGQLEWKVDSIVIMHLFGPKRQKQYHVY